MYKKDSSGNVHQYTYKIHGALESDQIRTQGGIGFDYSVLSIWRTYDGIGRPQKVTSRSGTAETSAPVNGVLYSYNKYGLTDNFYQNPSGEAWTGSLKVTYYYTDPTVGDHPGLRLTTTAYPNNLSVTEYYSSGNDDNLNRVTGRQSYAGATWTTLFSNEYLGAYRVTKRVNPSVPSGTGTTNYTWSVALDRFSRTSTLSVVTGAPYFQTINSYDYGYSTNSQATYRKELTSSGRSESYTYNSLDMLSLFKRGIHNASGDVPIPTFHQNWDSPTPPSLDHSGNWLNFNDNGTVHTATHNKSNEITLRDAAILTYDPNGNLLARANLIYKYDAWNRLVEVRQGGTQLLAFQYNGLHMKTKKTQYMDNGKYYYYGLNDQVLEERNVSTGMSMYSYVWGTQYIDELVGRRTETFGSYQGYWEYSYPDANYNTVTRVRTSPYGAMVYRYLYGAYGKPTQLDQYWSGVAITEDLYLFTGREYHQIAGIYDYRSRSYDPDLGRLLQRDTIGIWGDSINFGNGYGYVGNDPINLMDPYGNQFTCELGPTGKDECKFKIDNKALCDYVKSNLYAEEKNMSETRDNVKNNYNKNKDVRGRIRSQNWDKIADAYSKNPKSVTIKLVLCTCRKYPPGPCSDCNDGQTGAYAHAAYPNTIFVCCSGIQNINSIGNTMAHEISHALGGTDDVTSGENMEKAEKEKRGKPPAGLASDAYSYGVDAEKKGNATKKDYEKDRDDRYDRYKQRKAEQKSKSK